MKQRMSDNFREAGARERLAPAEAVALDASEDANAPLLVAAIEAQVRRKPDRLALVYEGRQITYRDLNSRANRLARCLRRRGAGRGVRIAVCLDRSLEMVVALLAVLKTGGAYVPLDPAYPAERLSYMIQDAGLETVLCEGTKVPESLPTACVLPLAAIADEMDRASGENLEIPIDAEDVAYVIYTSGSTGRPKGVEICHGGVANLLRAMVARPRLTEQDTVLSVHSISFDPSVLDLFLPLSVGARVVLVPRSAATDGPELARRISATGATLMDATPATWRLLLAASWQGSPDLRIRSGGEAMTRDLADALLSRCAELWNAYGPTEATVCTSAHCVGPGTGPVPIGRALPGTVTRILTREPDGSLKPVAQGSQGELFIGGRGVAKGYLNRPELTAERFLTDPFSNDPAARLYRTGDLVRADAAGVLTHIGRIDDQVKVRGYRIELGEVEEALLALEQVAGAAVVTRSDLSGEAQLVAYVVLAASPSRGVLAAEELRRALGERLPQWMVPTRFVSLDRLPLSPSGKVDRRALPDPGTVPDLQSSGSYVEPRTPTQRQLAGIWKSVLGREDIGLNHDFFDLGGHSLLVARLFGRIGTELGADLPLATIFEARTVEALAARIEAWEAAVLPGGVASSETALVRLKEGSLHQPLFLVIAMDEDSEIYLNLARHLEDGRAVLGIRAPKDAGDTLTKADLPAMAAQLLDRIVSIQPEGPYLLGGQCAGGVLAFEMALQLRRRGERVDLLLLMETADTAAARSPGHARAPWKTILRERMTDGMIGLATVLQSRGIAVPRLLSGRRSLNHPDRLFRYAFERYRPRDIFDGSLVLLRAQAGDGRPSDVPLREQYADPLFGWSKRVRGAIRAYDVPGGHGSMLADPNAAAVAQVVQRELAEAVHWRAQMASPGVATGETVERGPLGLVQAAGALAAPPGATA